MRKCLPTVGRNLPEPTSSWFLARSVRSQRAATDTAQAVGHLSRGWHGRSSAAAVADGLGRRADTEPPSARCLPRGW